MNNNYIYNVVGLVGTLYSSNNNIANSVGGILVSGNNVANSVGGLINSNICSMYHQLNFIQANAINPLYVTGFIDGEGCFHISITKKKNIKVGWGVQLFFQISLNEKDIALLEKIKYFFSVGLINYNQKTKSFLFIVSSSKDLSLIIDHLNLFPLITQKRADYELWKQAF